MDYLIQWHGKDKNHEPIESLRMFYHKENLRPMEIEMSLFPDKNAETITWDAITHTSGN